MSATVHPSTLSRLASLVDQLGSINAELAELTRQADAIKAELSCSGLREIDGTIYRATVVITERQTLDAAAVREILADFNVEAPMKSTLVQSVRVGVAK